MKKALALMLALAMIFSLAACGSTDQQPSDAPAQDTGAAQTSEATGGDEHEPVTLRIYVRYSDDDTILPYDYAVECLKEDMPWVTLELDAMPADDGVKLKSMVATGDLPDIFSLQGTDLINSMVQAGAVKDLTADIEENGFFDKVQPAAYSKLYHTDGKIYTLPYTSTEVALLFVNKPIFEENGVAIPTTIDEWVTASEELTAKGITVLPIFGKEQWICNTFYDALVTRYIPEGLTGLQQGTTSIRDEGYLKAAQDLERLAAAGAFPAGVTTLNYEQATNLWYNGEAAMFLNGQWEITTTDEYLGDKADWIPIPAATAEDVETSQYAFVGGSGTAAGLGVSAWSENYDVAVEVACYLAEKYAEYNYTQRGAATVAVQCDKPVEVEPPAMMAKLGEWMPKITSTTVLAGSGGNMELYTVLGEGTQSLLAGVMTPEEFIESIALVLGE